MLCPQPHQQVKPIVKEKLPTLRQYLQNYQTLKRIKSAQNLHTLNRSPSSYVDGSRANSNVHKGRNRKMSTTCLQFQNQLHSKIFEAKNFIKQLCLDGKQAEKRILQETMEKILGDIMTIFQSMVGKLRRAQLRGEDLAKFVSNTSISDAQISSNLKNISNELKIQRKFHELSSPQLQHSKSLQSLQSPRRFPIRQPNPQIKKIDEVVEQKDIQKMKKKAYPLISTLKSSKKINRVNSDQGLKINLEPMYPEPPKLQSKGSMVSYAHSSVCESDDNNAIYVNKQKKANFKESDIYGQNEQKMNNKNRQKQQNKIQIQIQASRNHKGGYKNIDDYNIKQKEQFINVNPQKYFNNHIKQTSSITQQLINKYNKIQKTSAQATTTKNQRRDDNPNIPKDKKVSQIKNQATIENIFKLTKQTFQTSSQSSNNNNAQLSSRAQKQALNLKKSTRFESLRGSNASNNYQINIKQCNSPTSSNAKNIVNPNSNTNKNTNINRMTSK